MSSGYSIEPSIHLRWLGLFLGGILLIGGLPIFARIAGFQFLPSTRWIETSWLAALGVGLACAVVLTILYARVWFRMGLESHPIKHLFVLAFSPFFCGSFGMASVTTGFPLILTLIIGEPAEQRYVVEKAEGFSDRKCRNGIELRELPFLFDSLCGFPVDFRESLRPGDELVVSGRSSFRGVFV